MRFVFHPKISWTDIHIGLFRKPAYRQSPACVTSNTTIQTSTLSDEIITLAHEIGGDGFNTFSHDDIDELLVDDALSDNDIIDLTLDVVVGLEGDNDEEEKPTPSLQN